VPLDQGLSVVDGWTLFIRLTQAATTKVVAGDSCVGSPKIATRQAQSRVDRVWSLRVSRTGCRFFDE